MRGRVDSPASGLRAKVEAEADTWARSGFGTGACGRQMRIAMLVELCSNACGLGKAVTRSMPGSQWTRPQHQEEGKQPGRQSLRGESPSVVDQAQPAATWGGAVPGLGQKD